ncbi:hypothetical protein ABZ401_06165 [Streptomyces sp. NPDC005892]|uniref:hypothetical protein n=1 Tax=Streptomyces sp. NPDC005892 TaxID=3155593 RepID=UPI0033F68DFF
MTGNAGRLTREASQNVLAGVGGSFAPSGRDVVLVKIGTTKQRQAQAPCTRALHGRQ